VKVWKNRGIGDGGREGGEEVQQLEARLVGKERDLGARCASR